MQRLTSSFQVGMRSMANKLMQLEGSMSIGGDLKYMQSRSLFFDCNMFSQRSTMYQNTARLASTKHKRIRKLAKGYRGKRKNCFRVSIQVLRIATVLTCNYYSGNQTGSGEGYAKSV